MTDAVTSSSALIDAAFAELDDVTAQIAQKISETEGLYERRRASFIQLRQLGVAQAAIARHCGLSPMAVAFAMKDNGDAKSKKGKRSA